MVQTYTILIQRSNTIIFWLLPKRSIYTLSIRGLTTFFFSTKIFPLLRGGWWDRKILTVFLWFLRSDLDPIYLDFRTRWHAKSYRFYVQYGLNIALLSAADWRPRIAPTNPFRAEKAARFIFGHNFLIQISIAYIICYIVSI